MEHTNTGRTSARAVRIAERLVAIDEQRSPHIVARLNDDAR